MKDDYQTVRNKYLIKRKKFLHVILFILIVISPYLFYLFIYNVDGFYIYGDIISMLVSLISMPIIAFIGLFSLKIARKHNNTDKAILICFIIQTLIAILTIFFISTFWFRWF